MFIFLFKVARRSVTVKQHAAQRLVTSTAFAAYMTVEYKMVSPERHSQWRTWVDLATACAQVGHDEFNSNKIYGVYNLDICYT